MSSDQIRPAPNNETALNGVYIHDKNDVFEALSDLVTLGYNANKIAQLSGARIEYVRDCLEHLSRTRTRETRVVQSKTKLKQKQKKANKRKAKAEEATAAQQILGQQSTGLAPQYGTSTPGHTIREVNDELFNYGGDLNFASQQVVPATKKRNLGKSSLGSKEWLNNLILEDSSDDEEAKNPNSVEANNSNNYNNGAVSSASASLAPNMDLTELQRIKEEKNKQIEKLRQLIKEREAQKKIQKQEERLLESVSPQPAQAPIFNGMPKVTPVAPSVSSEYLDIAINKKMVFFKQVEKLASDCQNRISGLQQDIAEYQKLIDECQKDLASEKSRHEFYAKKLTEVQGTIYQLEKQRSESHAEQMSTEEIAQKEVQISEQREKIHQLNLEIDMQKQISTTGNQIHPIGQLGPVENSGSPETVNSHYASQQYKNSSEASSDDNDIEEIPEQEFEQSEKFNSQQAERASNSSNGYICLPKDVGLHEDIGNETNGEEDNLKVSHTVDDIPDQLVSLENASIEDNEKNGDEDNFTPFHSSLTAFKSYRFSPLLESKKRLSQTWTNDIDPSKPFCPAETAGGRCNDFDCTYQHFDAVELTEQEIIQEIAKCYPSATKEEQTKYKAELVAFLRNEDCSDLGRLSQKIVDFRNSKMQKDSFLDWVSLDKAKKKKSSEV